MDYGGIQYGLGHLHLNGDCFVINTIDLTNSCYAVFNVYIIYIIDCINKRIIITLVWTKGILDHAKAYEGKSRLDGLKSKQNLYQCIKE